MYQANQEVVNQNTNIALVNIRQTEINYFTSFFSSFGTQCFFLTAILAGSVSQTPSFDCASGCNYLWQFIYNVSVSISMSFTALCLLNSVFISIYGQGLAIRGETGSMINAMHGMIAEQARVVQMFVVNRSHVLCCDGLGLGNCLRYYRSLCFILYLLFYCSNL